MSVIDTKSVIVQHVVTSSISFLFLCWRFVLVIGLLLSGLNWMSVLVVDFCFSCLDCYLKGKPCMYV